MQTLSQDEMAALRDKYRWRAETELRLHGETEKFYELMRSYRVIDSALPDEEEK